VNLLRSLAPKALWALFPLALLAAPPARIAPGQALAGTMEMAPSGTEIRVTLRFTNHSQRVVWLEKFEDGQMPMRSEFEIRSEDGRMVPYLGPTERRRALAKGDFFPLEPGQTSRREIRIEDRYEFPEGQRTYWVTFSYPTWNERTREAVFRTLKAEKFTYGR